MTLESAIDLVHRSTTRRKACGGCVKAKRRCDLTLPICGRCKIRALKCSYNGSTLPITIARDESLANQSTPETIPEITPATEALNITEFWPLISLDSVGTVKDQPILKVASFNFLERTYMEPHQIEYCIFELQRCISTLVLENRTLFLHPMLYEDSLPPAYQDVISICSLYTHKNAHNVPLIFRMLDLKLQALILWSNSIIHIEDRLLSVQALMLYQVIRMFDGDSKQRANADRNMDILEDWTLQLRNESHEAEFTNLNSHHLQWLLIESIRRTTMISVMIQGIGTAMNEGYCTKVPFMARLPVSENFSGWDPDEQTLQPASTEVVPYASYTDDWNIGKVNKVNDYEMLLITACSLARRRFM